jgi:hypothetical protein
VDFVTYEVPHIANGEAFPQAERSGTIPLNLSFYGLLVRLRVLGVTWLDVGTGLTLTSIYGVVALLLAALAGWRLARTETLATSRGRLVLAQLLLALVSIAAFRSPFVGSVYGFVPTLWLLILLAAGAQTTVIRVASLAAFAALHATQVLTPTPLPSAAATVQPSTLVLASTALVLTGALALNVGVVIRVFKN